MKYFFLLTSLLTTFAFAEKSIKNLDCDELLKKAKNETDILKNLAGLYANRNCKGFSFDFNLLTSLEKQIYKIKFEEIESEKNKTADKNESIPELLKSFKNEKNKLTQFDIFKKIRQKYKEANQKNEGLKLIKNYQSQLFLSAKKNIKSKSFNVDNLNVLNEVTSIYVRNLWNDDKTALAEKTLNDTIQLIEKKSASYNLYFLLAKIQEDQLLIESAVKNYDRAIKNYNESDIKKIPFDLAKVEWNKAWLQYLNDTPESAAISLRNIADKTIDSAEKSRALFFLAKIYKKMNKPEDSKKIFQENIQSDFFSFYSLASYFELGLKIPPINELLKTNNFDYKSSLSFLEEQNKKFFTSLIENEELEMADKASLVFSKNNSEYVKIGLYLASEAQFFMPLFTGFARSSIAEKKELFSIHSHLLFPQVHEQKVQEMSEKTKVSKSLIYSIMKQESGFNPEIRSPANALGLMQVIPPLAKTLAKKYKIEKYKKTEDLLNPLVNIELGTYELKDQVEKQNGQLSFVASAYNAGPGALKKWRNREPIKDMFEFIENIPYDETRTYVKIIARNMLFYQRLADPKQPQNFPEEFIKIVEVL